MIANIQPTLLGYIVLLVFLYVFYLLFVKWLASKKYHFSKVNHRVSVKVTYRFLGLLPVYIKTYPDMRDFELTEYEDDTNDDIVHKARIDLLLRSGEKMSTRQMVPNNDLKQTKAIAQKLTALLASSDDCRLVIDNGRILSLVLSLFIFVFWVVTMLSVLFVGVDYFIKYRSTATLVTEMLNEESAFQSSKLLGFPKDIPLPKGANIKSSEYDSDSKAWQLFLQTPLDEDGMQLTRMLQQAFKAQGWQTKGIETLPLQSEKYTMVSGGAFLFEFRKLSEQRYGSVTVLKGDPWQVIIDAPAHKTRPQ